ncbi:MAG: PAS domain-containing protein [Proteobacteria bacterium]|nr:PAS domain-containing protein [Pseudomonadota bacterium]
MPAPPPWPYRPQREPSRTADPRALDWERIENWTASVVEEDLLAIGKVFMAAGADQPEVVWNPAARDLDAPPLSFLLRRWSSLADGGLPHLRQIDPVELRPALGYIMLLDAIDGGRDFRYRLYGSKIAHISNLDMTGRLLSEHPASAYVAEFGIAVYRAALIRRAPVYSTRRPTMAEFTARWQRLALPLVDDSGAVVRILAATVAIGGDGNMIHG